MPEPEIRTTTRRFVDMQRERNLRSLIFTGQSHHDLLSRSNRSIYFTLRTLSSKIAFLLNFSINPKELELPIYLNMINIGAPHSDFFGSPPVLNTTTLALLDDFLSENDRRRTEIPAVDDRTRRLRDCRS